MDIVALKKNAEGKNKKNVDIEKEVNFIEKIKQQEQNNQIIQETIQEMQVQTEVI